MFYYKEKLSGTSSNLIKKLQTNLSRFYLFSLLAQTLCEINSEKKHEFMVLSCAKKRGESI